MAESISEWRKERFRGRVENIRRATVNTPGFKQPDMEKIAPPERVEQTIPNPRLAEPTPLTLRQFDGNFSLVGAHSDVRTVTEADLDEIGDYLPRFQQRFPAATSQTMLPLLKVAVAGGPYKFLKTGDAYALFGFSRVPWIPRGIVADMFTVGRDGVPSAHQVVKMCRVALEWAKSLGAERFQLSDELEVVAKRLGCNEVARWFVKTLD